MGDNRLVNARLEKNRDHSVWPRPSSSTNDEYVLENLMATQTMIARIASIVLLMDRHGSVSHSLILLTLCFVGLFFSSEPIEGSSFRSSTSRDLGTKQHGWPQQILQKAEILLLRDHHHPNLARCAGAVEASCLLRN